MIARRSITWVCAMLSLGLGACSTQQEELQDWMAQERNQTRPMVQPIPAPQKFNPQRYEVSEAVDPFSTQKLTVAIKQEAAQPNSAVAAEFNRRKEPLEAFPLDGMRMVGSVKRKGTEYALLKVDNLLYQVRVGDHLGQNYGKIMKITETEISLREIVQDASGEWIERPTALQLQEGGQ